MDRKQLTIYLVSYLTVSFVAQALLGIYMGYDWLERYTIIALSGIGFYAVLLLNTPKYLHDDCQKRRKCQDRAQKEKINPSFTNNNHCATMKP